MHILTGKLLDVKDDPGVKKNQKANGAKLW